MKTMDIEVVDIRKMKMDGKLKAVADIRIEKAITIKGFCVMEGDRGIFVSPPKKIGKDGRWYDTLSFESEMLKSNIQDKVLEAYDQEIVEAA